MDFLYYFQTFGYFFVVIASIFAMIASARVNSTLVLMACDVTDVRIARTSGNLTDHFNPKDNTIYLSDSVYDSSSTAAIGVAAHEAGHAIQHAEKYFPIVLRSAIVPVTNIGSKLSMPLIFIGLALNFSMGFSFGYEIALIGVFCYSLCVLFQLITLPTEFNASRRAVRVIEEGELLAEDELKGARKTLQAAAMTYVAALAVSLMQFLRLLSIVMGGRRKR